VATLYLVRHALATAPGDRRLPGADHGLRSEGWNQARALGERLRRAAPAAVYTSDALRSRQTAGVIAEACGVEVVVAPRLRELDFGEWGGRSYAEIVATEPGAAAYFDDPTTAVPPGGERVETAAQRVLAVLGTIGGERGGVVVGHAGSLRLALALALAVPLADYWRLRLDCAHLSVLDWSAKGVIVERLNDGCHLEGSSNGVAERGPQGVLGRCLLRRVVRWATRGCR
jgi:probable phosphoglycerate mutase